MMVKRVGVWWGVWWLGGKGEGKGFEYGFEGIWRGIWRGIWEGIWRGIWWGCGGGIGLVRRGGRGRRRCSWLFLGPSSVSNNGFEETVGRAIIYSGIEGGGFGVKQCIMRICYSQK